MSLDAFSQQYRQRIDALLQQHIDDLSDVAPTLKAAMRHGLLLGGKRVRPFLVYATGNRLGVADELLDGGSLYRIFKGMILCRQRILAVRTVGKHPNARCEITLEPEIIRVAPTPRRAFQGWRYLTDDDAPRDLNNMGEGAADLPLELRRELAELGLL